MQITILNIIISKTHAAIDHKNSALSQKYTLA